MFARLIAATLFAATALLLSPAPQAAGQANEGAEGLVTREGAIAQARYSDGSRDFADTSNAGGGREGTRTYECEWSLPGDARREGLTWRQLYNRYTQDFGYDPESEQTIQVRVLCYYAGTDNLAPWASPDDPLQPWSPAVEEPVPPVDPEALAMDAVDELTFPVPNGETSPPLESGTYAQLPTYFQVNDWVDLNATASAGPVTSTVTARPTELEFLVDDNIWYGQEHQILGEAECPAGGGGECVWTPPHSSDGQDTSGSPTGEPCFDLLILVRWEVSWTWTNSVTNEGGGPTILGESWEGSTTCLVVAEVQAVVDHG